MKCATKKIASEISKEKTATGGGTAELGYLSPNKERIMSLSGGILIAVGDEDVPEFGLTGAGSSIKKRKLKIICFIKLQELSLINESLFH